MNTTDPRPPKTIGYGFSATMTATPGKGNELVALLTEGALPGNPASSEHCIVYLISRSVQNPDLIQVIEGWTSIEEHHRESAGHAARAIIERIRPLVVGESPYTDFMPAAGKAF